MSHIARLLHVLYVFVGAGLSLGRRESTHVCQPLSNSRFGKRDSVQLALR